MVVPAAALAAEPAPKGAEGSFVLRGTHGYRIEGLIASTGKSGVLILTVAKKSGDGSVGVIYTARGEVTTEAVHFDLGGLGEIDVAVQPTAATEAVGTMCDGGAKTAPAQEYVGTIEFKGEERFTEVTTSRTPLLWGPVAQLVCGRPSTVSETSGEGVRGVRLEAQRKGGPSLQLNQNHPGAPTLYEAQVVERHDGLTATRFTIGHLGAGALRATPSLGGATFAGGGPFSGSATYVGTKPPREADPGRGTWSGDLTVDFPGRAATPLTGPGFRATIGHARRVENRG
jgi:hypothetical protein